MCVKPRKSASPASVLWAAAHHPALGLPSALSPALLTPWAASLYSVASEVRTGKAVGSCLIRSQGNRHRVFLSFRDEGPCPHTVGTGGWAAGPFHSLPLHCGVAFVV